MTELNIEKLNEVASNTVSTVLEQVELATITYEDFLGDLYGRLVVAHSLGWNVAAMTEDAKTAGDKLLEAVDAANTETEQE